jgi:drug/metabolite transporter (DMT)-like permease
MLASTISFSAMGALTKVAVPLSGLAAVIFWRSVVVTGVGFMVGRRRGVSLRPRRHGLLFLRSFVGFVAMGMYFWALGHIPIATATALLYTNPIFVVLLAGWLLGESRSVGTLVAVFVAFGGVLLILRPDVGDLDLGALLALGAGVLAAFAYLAVRRLRETESSEGIVVHFGLFSVLGSAPFAFGDMLPSEPSHGWMWLGIGLAAAGGQITMTRSYHMERASVVGPFSYATVVWAVLLGVMFFDEPLSVATGLGVALVVAAGVWMSRHAQAESPLPSRAAGRHDSR